MYIHKIRYHIEKELQRWKLQELRNLNQNSYQIIDMRDETEDGTWQRFPNAVHMPAEEIRKSDRRIRQKVHSPRDKKLVICCARGRFSTDVAEALCESGYDAVSLQGGYIAWLLDTMKQQEADEICADVEQSIRKKFHKPIWSKFTKAINQYELVKEGDRIAVCISGGKDSMLMAKLFQELKRHNKFQFDVKFLVMDPGYSPANRQVIEENARKLKVPITVFESDILILYTI